MTVQEVENGPGLRIVHHAGRDVVDEPVGRGGQEETTVRKGRPETRAEPRIGYRKGFGQPGIEREVGGGPVAHGNGGVAAWNGLLHAGHEPAVAAAGVLQVAGVPALCRYAMFLGRPGQMVGIDASAVRSRVAHGQIFLTTCQVAQVVIEGVVLHHQEHDVPDLGKEIGPSLSRWNLASGRVRGRVPFAQMPVAEGLIHVPNHRSILSPNRRESGDGAVVEHAAGAIGPGAGVDRPR